MKSKNKYETFILSSIPHKNISWWVKVSTLSICNYWSLSLSFGRILFHFNSSTFISLIYTTIAMMIQLTKNKRRSNCSCEFSWCSQTKFESFRTVVLLMWRGMWGIPKLMIRTILEYFHACWRGDAMSSPSLWFLPFFYIPQFGVLSLPLK
jgi:hypothetical protein